MVTVSPEPLAAASRASSLPLADEQAAAKMARVKPEARLMSVPFLTFALQRT
jgi:hypothetical protein